MELLDHDLSNLISSLWKLHFIICAVSAALQYVRPTTCDHAERRFLIDRKCAELIIIVNFTKLPGGKEVRDAVMKKASSKISNRVALIRLSNNLLARA